MGCAQQLNSVIHRSTAAVTVPAEASGDQSAEKGPPSHRGPTPQMGDTPPTQKNRYGTTDAATSDVWDFGPPQTERRLAKTRSEHRLTSPPLTRGGRLPPPPVWAAFVVVLYGRG